MSRYENQRRYIRFQPESNEYAQIDPLADRGEFVFEHVGLIIEEAPMGGCGLVVSRRCGLKKGNLCRIKLGLLEPLRAEIVWTKEISEEVTRLGCKFLE